MADEQSASRAWGATAWAGCHVPVQRSALPVPSVRRQNPSVGQDSEVIPPLVGSNVAAALHEVPFQRNHRPSWSTTTHIVDDTQSSPPLRSVAGSSAVAALQVVPFHRRTPRCGSSTMQNEADVHERARPWKWADTSRKAGLVQVLPLNRTYRPEESVAMQNVVLAQETASSWAPIPVTVHVLPFQRATKPALVSRSTPAATQKPVDTHGHRPPGDAGPRPHQGTGRRAVERREVAVAAAERAERRTGAGDPAPRPLGRVGTDGDRGLPRAVAVGNHRGVGRHPEAERGRGAAERGRVGQREGGRGWEHLHRGRPGRSVEPQGLPGRVGGGARRDARARDVQRGTAARGERIGPAPGPARWCSRPPTRCSGSTSGRWW